MNRTILRATTVALSTGALALGLVAPAGAATEERDAASWLAGQLDGSVVHNDQYDFDDLGLSLDVALALQSLDRKRATVRAVRDAVVDRAPEYIGYDPEQYAGATAKLLTVVEETGGDGTDAGGIDLVARLEGLTGDSGRVQDQSQYGDYTNTISQAFAVRGLSAAGSAEAWAAAQYLIAQQCEGGYFRLALGAVDSEDPSCDAGDPATTSAPDTDATAFAVLALQAVQGHAKQVRRALEGARAWLVETQRRNGAFGGGTSTKAPNANSTGLAGAALATFGACGKARRAARWVAQLQVEASDDRSLRGDVGAIAYDAKAFRAGEEDGITVETQDQWRRATAQAAPALTFLDKAACSK